MATPKRGPRLGAGPAHQRLMLAGLATELFRHGRIRTTQSKARTLRPYAEKLITRAKQGDVAARREVLKRIRDRDVVAYLFDDIAPRFADRPGGYTRIVKLGPRKGDSAPMALIELVEREIESAEEVIEERKRSRMSGVFGRRRRRRAVDEFADEDLAYDEEELAAEEFADEEGAGPEEDLTGEPPPRDLVTTAPDDEVGTPVENVDDTPDAGPSTGKPSS